MPDKTTSHWPWAVLALCMGVLAACSAKPPEAWSGYAEGDYVYIAAPLAGRLETLSVQAGQNIAQGAALFALESESENSGRDEAAARLAAARAQAADLDKGKRAEEVAVLAAQLAQAQAGAVLARQALERQQQLVTQGFVSKAGVQDASTALRQAQAKVSELQASLQVARLPGREDVRAATQASANAAQEVLRQSQWRSGQTLQRAPAAALVADVFFRPGEFVPAGQPVVSLLPPQNIKARFFVPESELASIHAGQTVLLQCDGCGQPIAARIARIATQPEYTPPVIYSNAQRAKLVFMVEAQPAPPDATRLKPGQPLDVRPDRRPDGRPGGTGTP